MRTLAVLSASCGRLVAVSRLDGMTFASWNKLGSLFFAGFLTVCFYSFLVLMSSSYGLSNSRWAFSGILLPQIGSSLVQIWHCKLSLPTLGLYLLATKDTDVVKKA